MVYNTERTEWPDFPINEATKNLISEFFQSLDSEDPKIGNKLADEIFAPEGRAMFSGKWFTGEEEIRKSRDNAWTAVSRRSHKLLKVFSANLEGDDLLFIGQYEIDFRNGSTVQSEFIGRLGVEGATSPAPKLNLYTVWADSAPIMKALKGE